MSAAVQEVILKLTADSSAFGQGTAQAKKELSVLEEAKKRLAAQDRQAQIRQQMDQLRPAAPVAPPPQPSALAGIGGIARGVLGGIAVDSILTGTITAMKDANLAFKSLDAVFRDIASNASESIPLFGGLVRSLKQITSEATGFPAISRAMAEFAEVSKLRGGEQAARMNGQDSFAFQAAGLGRGVGYAAASEAGARSFLAGLTPDRLASYRPRPMFGVANAASGDLQAALDLALSNEGAARRGVRVAGGGVNEAQALVRERQAQVEQLQRQADEAKTRADQAERTALTAERRGGFMQFEQNSLARRSRAAQEAALRDVQGIGDRMGVGQQGVANAQAEAQKRLQELQQKRNELAEKEFATAQARLALERNQLQLLQDRVGAMRSNATSLGLSGPGSIETLAEAYRLMKTHGIQSLTPELRQMLSGNALTGPETDRAAEAMMRRNPAFIDLVRKTQGMGPDELEAQERAGRDKLRIGEAQAQLAFRGQLREIGQDAANQLIPAIKEMVDAGIQEAIRKLREPMIAAQIAARQEGR